MAKFLRLVGNEWKKQFSKVATWVLLILLALGTIGFALIANLDRWIESNYQQDADWESQLEYYQSMVASMSSDDYDYTEYQANVAYYRYLVENNISRKDWRLTEGLIWDMANAMVRGSSEEAARLQAIVDHNDCKAYYEWILEKEIASDPEHEEIYRWAAEYSIANKVNPSGENWKNQTVQRVKEAKLTIAIQEALLKSESNRAEYSESRYQSAKDDEALGLYRLENNQENNPADSFESRSYGDNTSAFWDTMVSSTTLFDLVGLLCIVVGGSIVSNEFSSGTVKFLLINPIKRWKILMSKYATTLLFGLAATVLVFVLSFLLSLILNGGTDAFRPAFSVKNGVVVTGSPYLRLIGRYLLTSVKVVVLTTFAFAMSSLIHSSALAIGLSLFAYMSGSLIVTILRLSGADFARYLIFANMDFEAIVNKTTGFAHHSLPVAIVIVVLHMIVFLLTAWDGFVRREV